MSNFFSQLARQISKKNLILGIILSSIVVLISIGSLIYLQNNSQNSNRLGLDSNQRTAQTECQQKKWSVFIWPKWLRMCIWQTNFHFLTVLV